MRIAFSCPPVPGHLYPMTALAQAVLLLGHEVFFLGIPDAEQIVRDAGLKFVVTGASRFPLGETVARGQQLSLLSGEEAIKYTMAWFVDGARAILEDGVRVLNETQPDAMVLDASQTGFNLIALQRALPFVSVANALHFDFTGRTPLCIYPWDYEDSRKARIRNLEGLVMFGKTMAPLSQLRNDYIAAHGIPIKAGDPDAGLSPLAIITQCPFAFDFPENQFPAHFHHAGPFHATSFRAPVEFPWDRLTSDRLIYASMGTLQNGSEDLFRKIVAAVEAPGRQLVLSIGRNLDIAAVGPVAANTIVVRQAPQLLLLEKASLCITHAGLNTTLEALSAGVPLVAIPITNDQPGVASRIRYSGTGRVIPFQHLSIEALREDVSAVLNETGYRERAREMQAAIQKADSLNKTAELIDQVFRPSRQNI